MSFEIQGTVITPDYKAKERVLRTVIASRDAEIAELKMGQLTMAERIASLVEDGDALRSELRALRSKEYRRAKRRKKVAE